MKAIKYSDVKKLGFKRYQMNDSVFENMHGYDDFYMELKVGKYRFVWMNEHDYVKINKMKSHNIISTLRIYSLQELKTMVSFFTGNDYKNVCKLNEPNTNSEIYAA